MIKEDVTIIIPAYQPDGKLLSTIENLAKAGFCDLLIIDDGSDVSCSNIFEAVQKRKDCTLLVHEQNKGKGAALKTAFRYVLENREGTGCVVTADADGQHLPVDIEAVAKACADTDEVILGVRNFSVSNVPARSAFGNKVTSGVFRLFFGMKIKDTQTGLRAIPVKYLKLLLEAEGERYEYETNMLFMMNKHRIAFEQVEIHTVYLEENQSSHFRVVRDSIRIYGLIIKYLFSSLSASVIDELLFYCLKKLLHFSVCVVPSTFIAAFLARVCSSLYNYFMNAKHVFKGTVSRQSLVRYYLLAIVQIAASAALVYGAEWILHISAPSLSTLVKTVIDTVLFFISFRIQHKWVFVTDGNPEE